MGLPINIQSTGGYGAPTGIGANPWFQLGMQILDTAGDIFGNSTGGQPAPVQPPITYVPPVVSSNQGSWFDDLFNGGTTVNIAGFEVPRTVIIIAVVYFLFFKGKSGIRL